MSSRCDRGAALLETFLLGLLLLVPLLWLLGVLSHLHQAALASTAAAREAGSDAARSFTAAGADGAVEDAVARAFLDHGLDPSSAHVRWSPGSSPERGRAVEVSVSYPVRVFVAPFLGRVSGPAVWVHARHVARVDPYRSRE